MGRLSDRHKGGGNLPPFRPIIPKSSAIPAMIPEILSETLATLRRFDPNGDWHTPDLPCEDDDLEGWAHYFTEVADLAEAARLAMIRLQKAARRGEAF